MSKKLFLGLFMMAMNFVMAGMSYELDPRSLNPKSIPYATTIKGVSVFCEIEPFPGYQVRFEIIVSHNMNSAEVYNVLNRIMAEIEDKIHSEGVYDAINQSLDQARINQVLNILNNSMTQQTISQKNHN